MLDPQTLELLRQFGIDQARIHSLLLGSLVFTGVTVLSAIPTVAIARRKHRSAAAWLMLALSIPLIPLLLVLVLPALADPKKPE